MFLSEIQVYITINYIGCLTEGEYTGIIIEKKIDEEDEYDESRRRSVRTSVNVDSDSD